jgi:hypothetical protein
MEKYRTPQPDTPAREIKYALGTLPREVIVYICSFYNAYELPCLLNASLLNKNWFLACCTDVLWKPHVMHLINEGTKPIPTLKRRKDERGNLRGFCIDLSKRECKIRAERVISEIRRQRREKLAENISTYFLHMSFGAGTLYYLVLSAFFVLLGIWSAIPNVSSVYIMIPLWISFAIMLIYGTYTLGLYFVLRRGYIFLTLGVITWALLIFGVVQSFIVLLNIGILPTVPPSTDDPYTQYQISWFLVLIPSFGFFTFIILPLIILAVFVVMNFVKEYNGWKNVTKEDILYVLIGLALVAVPSFMLMTVVMIAATTEFPIIHTAFIFIPLYIIEIGAIIVLTFLVVRGYISSSRFFIYYIWGIVIVCSFILNQIFLSLGQYLYSYMWFSSLLPLTTVYILLCIYILDVYGNLYEIFVRCSRCIGIRANH